ncbi:MAG: efflux RND transporter periplasmic adaptor subunit [Rikenellaceae bacterium]
MRFYTILIMLFFLLSSCKRAVQIVTFERPVSLYKVESLSYVDKTFSAMVESAQQGVLSFQMGGEIEKIYVEEGSKVKKGAIIAIINPIDYKLKVESAKAQFEASTADMERYKRLLERDAISQQQYEAAYANYISRRSSYQNAMQVLENTKIFAPFSGVIERKYADNFEWVQPYQQIVKVVNPDTLDVVFTISPLDAKILQAPVVKYFVEFENYPNRLFSAKLIRFTDVAIGGEGFPMTIGIDDVDFSLKKYDIKAGYSCSAIIRIDNPQTNEYSSIPLSAIYEKIGSNQKYVWIYNSDDSKVELKPIETGELFGENMIVVKEGISSGDLVVTAGIYQLSEGQSVKPLN